MFEDDEIEGSATPEDNEGEGASEGDGLHHHEIHEDEGGGFHSKHTHPDGRVEHEDHTTYEDARDHMDRMYGHGEPDGDEDSDGEDSGGEVSAEDVAGSYGRHASRD